MRLNYIPRRNIFEPINYGYLYNWYAAAQPQSVEYGYLYNAYTALDIRDIANTGWSVPTSSQASTLITYLGGSSVAGGKLKETGTASWSSPNAGATNEVEFNAKGAGTRSITGDFIQLGEFTGFIIFLGSDTGILRMFYDSSVGQTADVGNTNGYSIRLIKDTTTLSHGETGTYIGNDGRVYKTICIGTQEWLSENLMETKYQNGDAIPEVTDNTTWSGLTTGARCSYNNLESNAVVDTEIANVGWHVPTDAETRVTLINYIGGVSAGGKLKETGTVYWDAPNAAATNELMFNWRGSGLRDVSGIFSSLKAQGNFFFEPSPSGAKHLRLAEGTLTPFGVSSDNSGYSIRLMKDSTTLTHGQAGTYTGNDGKVYRTICIGTQEWLADNIKETKYRDGSLIPVVTDNTEWAGLTTGARCVYDNLESNA